MAWNIALIVTAVIIIAIWVLIEMKRFRHKFFAVILIVLILLFYVSAFYVFKGRNVDFKSFSGVKDATAMYFSFLKTSFVNAKSITSNAIKMNWNVNSTALDPNLRED